MYESSFASHERSKYWSSRNEKIPRNVYSGGWCPHCMYKTEQKIYEMLFPLYPTIIREFKQDWCKNINYLPFDFCLPDINILIELDGPQHFRQVSNWTSPEKTTEIDKYKEQCANANNYSVIRILQEDVWLDKYDWFPVLCNAIEDIKRGGDIMNIYLCEKNEYNGHIK
jgi:very-short-patch-repair endonuclease